jgi:hypothetical protein
MAKKKRHIQAKHNPVEKSKREQVEDPADLLAVAIVGCFELLIVIMQYIFHDIRCCFMRICSYGKKGWNRNGPY